MSIKGEAIKRYKQNRTRNENEIIQVDVEETETLLKRDGFVLFPVAADQCFN